MIHSSNSKCYRKLIYITTIFCIMSFVMIGYMFTTEVNAANIEFETFLNSVNAGEFVLSNEDSVMLTQYVESGNTSAAMEIYRDYFSKEGQLEAAIRESSNDQITANQTSDVQASDVQVSDVQTSDVQASDVQVSDVQVSDVQVSDIQVKDVQLNTNVMDAGVNKVNVSNVVASANDTVKVKTEQTDTKSLVMSDVNPPIPAKNNNVDKALKDAIVAETVIAGEVISSIIPKQEKKADTKNEELIYGLTAADYDALCRIVEAEAGGESSDGKVMVANVVMNRVYSSVFPNTVNEVVAQRGQFSPYRNGSFKRAKPSESTVIAVNKALSGVKLSNALYFKAKRTGLKWGRRELVSICGNHAFYN